MPTTVNSTLPIGSVSGRCASTTDIAKAPTPGAARKQPEAPRPGLQDVAGEHREQRRRGGEEHRAHVERNRAEDHAIAPDELEAAQQRLEAHRLARARHALHVDQEDEARADAPERDGQPVDRCRTEPVQQPAEDGPTITPIWFDDANQAVADGTTGRGTSAGMIATMVGISKARPAPTSAMMM